MSKALVAYFSASGVTAKLAKRLASAAGVDLFEIKPETAYTKADLDWTDQMSRSTKEMRDKSFRPLAAARWRIWANMMRFMLASPLEGYDLTGKAIVPFAASGGSSMGNTSAELKSSRQALI